MRWNLARNFQLDLYQIFFLQKQSCMQKNVHKLPQTLHRYLTNFSTRPAGNYMFKANNKNTRTKCEICSKLTIKIPERRRWHICTYFTPCSSVFIVNFEKVDAGRANAVNLLKVSSNYNKTTLINPFQANIPFLYPLKTSENRSFSDVFRGYRNGKLDWNGFLFLLC